jgi:hypothetical protein
MEFGQQNFNAGYEGKGNEKYGANEQSSKKDYSKEFERKPLKADTEEEYGEKMWEEDKKYLDEWLEYERRRFDWLKEKLEEEKKIRTEIAGDDFEERRKVLEWFGNSTNGIYDQWSEKMKKIFDEKSRINEIYFHKKFNIYGNKNEEKIKSEFENIYQDLHRKVLYTNFADIDDVSYIRRAREFTLIIENIRNGNLGIATWQAKLNMLKDFQRRVDNFLREADDERRKQKQKKPGGESGRDKKPNEPKEPQGNEKGEKNAESIAIKELGITKYEFDMIIRNTKGMREDELIRLTMKVVGANDKNEIKGKYRECVKEWHPDKKNTRFGIGVNEIKLKIANNLYGEYKKRFEK